MSYNKHCATIIERSRKPFENEFVFGHGITIQGKDLTELFAYINKVSNVEITLDNDTEIVWDSGHQIKWPLIVRVEKKTGDEPYE